MSVDSMTAGVLLSVRLSWCSPGIITGRVAHIIKSWLYLPQPHSTVKFFKMLVEHCPYPSCCCRLLAYFAGLLPPGLADLR